MNRGFFRPVATTALVVVACCWLPDARAACNLTVDANLILSDGSRERVPDGLPFRGRVGRISQAVVMPGVTESLEVGADPICKSRPLPVSAMDRASLIAMILYRAPDGAVTHAHVVTSAAACASATSDLKSAGLGVSCSRTGGPSATAEGRVRIPYPSKTDLQGKDGRIPSGGVSVVVMGARARDGASPLERISGSLAANRASAARADGPCAILAPTAAEFVENLDGYVCVDQIFRDSGAAHCAANDVQTWRVGPAYLNRGMSELVSFAGPTDFADACTPQKDPPEGLPKCEDRSPPLEYFVASDGTIAFPFIYTRIRGGQSRRLSGASALPRAPGTTSAIHLPGVEYVGSVPIDSDAPSRNPAKPGIEISRRSNDFVLRLTDAKVDQDNSVVTLQPRLMVSVFCKDDGGPLRACQCFDTNADTAKTACAVDDRCMDENSAQCSTAEEPGYFHCEPLPGSEGAGFQYTGLPCTRGNHCGLGGRCVRAVCVPQHAVWTQGWQLPENPEPCTTDARCGDDRQCGLSLFHFPVGEAAISHIIDDEADGQQGVCESTGERRRCTDDDCGVFDRCVGYQLEALEKWEE